MLRAPGRAEIAGWLTVGVGVGVGVVALGSVLLLAALVAGRVLPGYEYRLRVSG